MSNKDKFKSLVQEANNYAGSERGNKAKIKYEIEKMEQERKRNFYLFLISIALFSIAVTNLVFAILKYINCP